AVARTRPRSCSIRTLGPSGGMRLSPGRRPLHSAAPAVRQHAFFRIPRSSGPGSPAGLTGIRVSPWPLLSLAGIVVGVDVVDGPRALPVDLNDRLALGPSEVLHAGGHAGVGPRGQGRALLLVELASHAEVESAGDDREAFVLGMRVRSDLVAV